jgi:GNAT superfamily N-acetyltransferase
LNKCHWYLLKVVNHFEKRNDIISIVDPIEALTSFQQAYRAGQVQVQSCELQKEYAVHQDSPNGEPRLTYVKLEGDLVTAVAILILAEPINGEQCFGVGYAVRSSHRGRGLAKAIVKMAIAELANGIGRQGVNIFHVEAIVSQDNIPSQHVAMAILSPEGKQTTDEVSGEPAIQYVKRVLNEHA